MQGDSPYGKPFPPPITYHGKGGQASTVHRPDDPYAGLRRHVPKPGELEALGVDSVDGLVAAVNDRLGALGRPPLNRGEFPTNRAGFLRVGRLVRSIPDPTSMRAVEPS